MLEQSATGTFPIYNGISGGLAVAKMLARENPPLYGATAGEGFEVD